jgi:putative acetyltransferase
MFIREAFDSDLDAVMSVERAAFGSDEEAGLVAELLVDPSAMPVVSLLAFDGDNAVGHILFTKAGMVPDSPLSASLLAPLAVVPGEQKKGIGGELIEHGLKILSESGVDLVFVLGHPSYYPRFGFEPAGRHGFDRPYLLQEKTPDAWMVKALRQRIIGSYSGTVTVADTLDKPEYW